MELDQSNFAFLAKQDIQLVRLGALAERYFHDDPNSIKPGGIEEAAAEPPPP
jgi:hypothetical protein